MDRDTFIITVYCLVDEHYAAVTAQHQVRRGGFAPALSDSEVITMEICGEYFKLDKDKDLFAYFRDHYRHFFPALGDRPSFVRQAANLWLVKEQIQQRLVRASGQDRDGVQPIDTLPLPVCVYTRAPRDRGREPQPARRARYRRRRRPARSPRSPRRASARSGTRPKRR